MGAYRDIAGDRWLQMGPGARLLARVALVVRLRDEMVAGNGAVMVGGGVRESTVYDEQGRLVRLCAEVDVELPRVP